VIPQANTKNTMSVFLSALGKRERPLVMGVLNCTPDSFSDGGRYTEPQQALERALAMQAEGADIVDIGGESTRPGAKPVSVAEELARVIPCIELIRQQTDLPLSIDTSQPEVMQAAAAAGVDLINDVRALTVEGALEVAVKSGLPVCLMHMQGTPESMQIAPSYTDLLNNISDDLRSRIEVCEAAGLLKAQIIIDPGFGFGKTVTHNLLLTKHLSHFESLGCPILYGCSRKSTIGNLLDRDPEHRLAGGLALTTIAVQQGAAMIRTHDVAQTLDAIKIAHRVQHL
jgi:dihydropteroate synthase